MDARLESVDFAALAGFSRDDCAPAYATFLASARAIGEGLAATRPARPAPPGLTRVAGLARAAGPLPQAPARRFFEDNFRAFTVAPADAQGGFVTGYYEPRVKGALAPSARFSAPIFARPDDLVSLAPGEAPPGFDPALSGARRGADGVLRPYPERAAIEADPGRRAIVWLEDAVEVFLIQVQGSASVELPDGRVLRLAYDGRNGQPYTSIGKILIARGAIAESAMSLASMKAWLRANGLAPGEPARAIMRRNRSYVFFKLEGGFDPATGPIGGAGLALAPLRSIAVDRSLWPYGTPFFIAANLPWQGPESSAFARLMIAQDTGSAILGPARADIFFGGGDAAGERAGAIRHGADFAVLLAREDAP